MDSPQVVEDIQMFGIEDRRCEEIENIISDMLVSELDNGGSLNSVIYNVSDRFHGNEKVFAAYTLGMSIGLLKMRTV